MVVTDPNGSLADVRAARRTLNARFDPPMYYYLAWAAVFAVFCGSRSCLLEMVGAAALAAATVAAVWWQSRRARFICPRRLRLFSRRVFALASLLSLLSLAIVLVIIGVAIAMLLHRSPWVPLITHRGTLLAYGVPFVVFIVPVLAAVTLPWWIEPYGIDGRALRKAPDHPAALVPAIATRQRIMVCAMLAGLDWIEAGFLAKTMDSSEDELRRQTAELVAAQYINLHAYNGRWWFGFTAVGRAAYRRHLRALQGASAGQPTEQPTMAAEEFL